MLRIQGGINQVTDLKVLYPVFTIETTTYRTGYETVRWVVM